MTDFPLAGATTAVWIYWIIVGAMSWRVRRRTRRLAGVVPQQALERRLWLVWVPMVALHAQAAPFAVPAWAREGPYAAIRVVGALVAIGALVATIECWKRMGRNWRMAVTPGEKTELVTTGLYRSIRHPIYALSILLVAATAFVLPTWPMIAIALTNATLVNLKARNEERHLLGMHGDAYAAYLADTGRFLPRLFARR